MRSLWQKIGRSITRALTARRLKPAEIALMQGVAAGGTLKSHRFLDGQKLYKFYPRSDNDDQPNEPVEVPYDVVQYLLDERWMTTNQKFPAATFLLTSKGQELVSRSTSAVQGVNAVVKFDT